MLEQHTCGASAAPALAVTNNDQSLVVMAMMMMTTSIFFIFLIVFTVALLGVAVAGIYLTYKTIQNEAQQKQLQYLVPPQSPSWNPGFHQTRAYSGRSSVHRIPSDNIHGLRSQTGLYALPGDGSAMQTVTETPLKPMEDEKPVTPGGVAAAQTHSHGAEFVQRGVPSIPNSEAPVSEEPPPVSSNERSKPSAAPRLSASGSEAPAKEIPHVVRSSISPNVDDQPLQQTAQPASRPISRRSMMSMSNAVGDLLEAQETTAPARLARAGSRSSRRGDLQEENGSLDPRRETATSQEENAPAQTTSETPEADATPVMEQPDPEAAEKGGVRSSIWELPTKVLQGLRGSTNTKTWGRRVEVSHRQGFVDALNLADKLGAGAFGQVFQCQWEGARAAVKLITLEGSSDANKQDSVETFMQEAEVAALLRHPNIVQVYKVNLENYKSEDKKGFMGAIVMEFCELGSLADAISNDMFTFQHSNSPLLDLQLMLKVAEDVARGMLFLHNQDILHGDLKPNNVLLKQHNDAIGAKLTDFGLSVRMSTTQTHVSQHQSGTLDHMAPEVMMDGRSSKRSDVYAYGILLWEIFCCTRPYIGMRDVAIVHKVVEENMRPPFPKDAPREYVELASSCWEKDVNKRPDFSEIVARLEQMNLILMRLLSSDIVDEESTEQEAEQEAGTDETEFKTAMNDTPAEES